jgi:hypothetical protein
MFKLFDLVEIAKKEGKNSELLLEKIAKGVDKGQDSFEIYEELYTEVYGNHLCNTYCKKFVEMMYNTKEKGEKWTVDQTSDVARKIGISFSHNEDDYTQYEFYTAMHMMYYDYSEVFEEQSITLDPVLFAKMADAYLDDIDSFDGKLLFYFFDIIKNLKK